MSVSVSFYLCRCLCLCLSICAGVCVCVSHDAHNNNSTNPNKHPIEIRKVLKTASSIPSWAGGGAHQGQEGSHLNTNFLPDVNCHWLQGGSISEILRISCRFSWKFIDDLEFEESLALIRTFAGHWPDKNSQRTTRYSIDYGVALVSRINEIIGLFCKRALQKRQYSAKETYNFIDATDRSHRICEALCDGPCAIPLELTHTLRNPSAADS